MQTIIGKHQLANKAQHFEAKVILQDDGTVMLYDNETDRLLQSYYQGEYDIGDLVPGLPVELMFKDGALFIPNDTSFRWPQMVKQQFLAAWLETHWSFVIAASLFVPFFLWLMTVKVLPAAADASVPFLPDMVSEKVGQQTLAVLDETMLQPTELEQTQQQDLNLEWQQMLTNLNYPQNRYHLKFRKSGVGANAFALPDGTIVVTDDLVKLMADHQDELKAVLLHEIGHIDHQHGMKQVARSTAITLMFTLILGDIEGAGEMIIGAGGSLLQASFSRDMEREADSFSHQQLVKLGITPSAFGNAIKLLAESHGERLQNGQSEMSHWLEYLSSHPSSEERIKSANGK